MSKKRQFQKVTISSNSLILLSALYVAIFANVNFFKSVSASYGLTAETIPFIGSLFLYITSLFILVLSVLCHRALIKPLLITFFHLSAIIAYFGNQYGTIFDHQMIANVLETDTAEARDLLNLKMLGSLVGLGVIPSLLVLATSIKKPDWKTETIERLKLAGAAGVVIAGVFLIFSGHYIAMMRERRDLPARINPTYALYSAVKLAAKKHHTGSNAHQLISTDAKRDRADHHSELVIFVVGETVRADHWGLNGYTRDTTPLLRQERVINFPDFWSCGTSTAISVPCMFSNLNHSDFDKNEAGQTDNALDILHRAGVSVLWRDNNSSSKGVADRLPYQNFRTPERNIACDEIECRDEGMLVGLQEFIDKQDSDILIVLHQMGNHGPSYYKRYPKAFEHFKPACKTNDLGSCTQEQIVNAYDNAIRYTDYFLAKVIELLKRNTDKFETAMLYASDHGESLGEYGMYLHGAPYFLAPESQRHVPTVVWLGDSIRHDIKLNDIQQRRQRRWSHDNIFATLLGLFEIRSKVYKPDMDLFEHRYHELTGINN